MYDLVAKWIVYKGVRDEIAGMAEHRDEDGWEEAGSQSSAAVPPSPLPRATADSDLSESLGPRAP